MMMVMMMMMMNWILLVMVSFLDRYYFNYQFLKNYAFFSSNGW